MNGGVLHAVEVTGADATRAEEGFTWLRLPAVAELVARVREVVEGGVLDDLERSEVLELQADAEYARLVPEDAYLQGVLRLRLGQQPGGFAPI
jgi:hypothetical protein